MDETKEREAFEVEDSKHAGWGHLSSYHEMRWQVWLARAKLEADNTTALDAVLYKTNQTKEYADTLTAETTRRKAAEEVAEYAAHIDEECATLRNDPADDVPCDCGFTEAYDAWRATLPKEEGDAT